MAYALALLAGVASALVGSDLFKSGKGSFASAAPYLGAVAAVAVAVTTVFDAQGKTAAHKAARAGFEDLRVEFRRFAESTVYEGGYSEAKAAFDLLEVRHSQLRAYAPEPGNYARWVTRRKHPG